MKPLKILQPSLIFVFSFVVSSLAAKQHECITVVESKAGKEISKGFSGENKDERLSKRNKCCKLGREVAKIGDVCSHAGSLAALRPEPHHFHVMKTSLWQKKGANPINIRKVRKCRRFKAYYEKCCQNEAANIEKDIRRLTKDLKRFLHDKDNFAKETMTKEGQDLNDESVAVLVIQDPFGVKLID